MQPESVSDIRPEVARDTFVRINSSDLVWSGLGSVFEKHSEPNNCINNLVQSFGNNQGGTVVETLPLHMSLYMMRHD